VAGYQKVLQLSYVDKFLDDIHREIRDRYRNQIANKLLHPMGLEISDLYTRVLLECEKRSFEIASQPKQMRSYEESKKSKKTVASMIERPGEKKVEKISSEKMKLNDLNENEENGGGFMAKISPKGVMRKPGPGKYLQTKSPKPASSAVDDKNKKKPKEKKAMGVWRKCQRRREFGQD